MPAPDSRPVKYRVNGHTLRLRVYEVDRSGGTRDLPVVGDPKPADSGCRIVGCRHCGGPR